MIPVVVVDTNVVVAGLLTARADAPTALVLDGMLSARFSFLLSLDLVAEYREVLLRPRITARHGLGEADVDVLLAAIVTTGILVDTGASPSATDPGDDHLWALLHARPGVVLVTGDALLLASPPAHASVIAPLSFTRLLAER